MVLQLSTLVASHGHLRDVTDVVLMVS